MPSGPEAAVVVSTYNRAHLLPRLIASLEAQEGIEQFEVAVVDDASRDGTWPVLQRLAESSSLPIRIHRMAENSGQAVARDAGWRMTTAPYVVFTDDDCVPDPKWLATLVEALGAHDVVQGRTDVDPDEAEGSGPFARREVRLEWTFQFETTNIGYRRSVLERVGGFDRDFLRRSFGEDADLGWRAVKTGATTTFVTSAVVIHDVVTTGSRVRDWIEWVKDARRRQHIVLLVKKHPEARRNFCWWLFYRRSHPPLLAALLGLVLVSRRRTAARAALVVPYVVHRTVVDPFPSRPRYVLPVLAMTFVGDVAELAAIVKGAIRYRSLVL